MILKLRSKHFSFLLVGVWAITLFSYFGPWVGRKSAALAWNAYDLFDILRLLPDIQTGALIVNLQTLRLPLVGLGVLLPVLLAERRWPWRLAAALMGSALIIATLPPYPQILDAWHTPGWRIPFWWGIGTIVSAFAMIWLAPQLGYMRFWTALAWIPLTTIPAAITFYRLLPALSTLHATMIQPGWGFWLSLSGFLVLALLCWYQGMLTWEKSL
jgi:hypothetical protein